MSKIVDFRNEAEKLERCVWKCDCGNCSFMLYDDGGIQCADCEAFQNDTGHEVAIAKWTKKNE